MGNWKEGETNAKSWEDRDRRKPVGAGQRRGLNSQNRWGSKGSKGGDSQTQKLIYKEKKNVQGGEKAGRFCNWQELPSERGHWGKVSRM